MKLIKPQQKLTKKELRYFAKMAGEAYINDPVHAYATKDIERRKKFVYHFQMERLNSSNGVDYIYIDDENRGICVWREARNEYTVLDFLKCPDWIYLYIHPLNIFRTLKIYSKLDVTVFPEGTWIISPVFVDPAHQGKGIATALIKQGIADLTAMGYKCGLEAQSEENVKYYEKLGFKTIAEAHCEKENIHHWMMMYEENSQKS